MSDAQRVRVEPVTETEQSDPQDVKVSWADLFTINLAQQATFEHVEVPLIQDLVHGLFELVSINAPKIHAEDEEMAVALGATMEYLMEKNITVEVEIR